MLLKSQMISLNAFSWFKYARQIYNARVFSISACITYMYYISQIYQKIEIHVQKNNMYSLWSPKVFNNRHTTYMYSKKETNQNYTLIGLYDLRIIIPAFC